MAPAMSEPEHIFPCPVFEGSEKRISVSFAAAPNGNPPANGLRALTRQQLDTMLDLAACQIVSTRTNHHFDAYVLSESSLFVYPDRFVLKTCGTTKLLNCVPFMLELASGIDMTPSRVKYTRASFLFPDQQPAPHHGFDHECKTLREVIPELGLGSAYVLGDALNGLQWHTYVAGSKGGSIAPTGTHGFVPRTTVKPRHTLEICMTGLCPEACDLFVRGDDFISSQHVTAVSGIQALIPGQEIDDYVFEPCGYSMNGMYGPAFSTIHITPEDGFSYASFEVSGYDAQEIDAHALVAAVTDIFRPVLATVTISTDGGELTDDVPKCEAAFSTPSAYDCASASYQELKCGGHVAFLTLHRRKVEPRTLRAASMRRDNTVSNLLSIDVPATKTVNFSGSESDGSPRAVLKHFPSFKTLTSAASFSKALSEYNKEGGISDTTSDQSSDRLCNSMMSTEMNERTFDDIVTLNGAAPLPKGDAVTIDAHIRCLASQHGLEDNFYVLDLGAVKRLYHAWHDAMPRVHPHYAVKCNNDPALVAALAALGAGFDCASESEVLQVLSLGVSPDRIVFANPCKRPCDIRLAANKGVNLSTFDTESELMKLARYAPDARVLLRIRADDPTARCQLGNKFGAEEQEWQALFAAALDMGIPVDGVSFHVGSGATNPIAFSYAVELARKAFDIGIAMGHEMNILDIGGGFCGGQFDSQGHVDLGGVPVALNAALDLHFPESIGVKIIAEPGRFFAESVATMSCLVFGQRRRVMPQGDLSYDYWITDGLYGSMNCLLYDHATLAPRPLGWAGNNNNNKDVPVHPSTVFGPTCDGLDTVVRDFPLPELKVGDWLVFPSMGAYTLCGASKFNGINAVDIPVFYVCSQEP